ncbi:MAG: type III-B CRISPR module RAMP protein Cmr4 [bacterium]
MSTNTEIKKDYLVDLLFMYALTPVHMGSGQSLSYVDLPIQREKVTSFPVLWSSGIKGVFRTNFSRYLDINSDNKNLVDTIFGPEDSDDSFSSCISITDAKILFYPVRSLKGVLAYITSPFVLKRFFNELSSLLNKNNELNKNNAFNDLKNLNLEDNKIVIKNDSILKISDSQVALEEFVFDIDNSDLVNKLFEVELSKVKLFKELKEFVGDNDFEKRVAIVSDNVFKDFVNYSVEIRTRIRIDQEKGVTKEKALFTQEFTPSNSIFYSFIFTKDSFNQNHKLDKNQVNSKINEFLNKFNILQFGSDETLGKGLIKLKNINLID